jgi:sirohydrochlorin ferrochelatase/(2Fe-2S) ferredoxin
VELATPSLDAALLQLGRRVDGVVALPLFLFAAGHVKNDLPLALSRARAQLPEVRFGAARPLGVHPRLAALLSERVAAAGPDKESGRTAVVVVGRGASDPDANGDFCKLVRLFAEGRDYLLVAPSFIGITRPSVEEALELAARARPERIVVVPYLLFAGRLVAKLAAQLAAFGERYPWIKTTLAPHVGCDPRLFDLVDERLADALPRTGQRGIAEEAAPAPLPCDTCQYRSPLPGRASEVGGLRALLWSLRHGFTHTQAMPHEHAHRPLSKHVLVCGNADCAERGGVALAEALRRGVRDAGRERDIRITKTACMGRCGEGPTVAVYPDGVWYRGVAEADAAELVREHLLADRLVGRLVDNIMQ